MDTNNRIPNAGQGAELPAETGVDWNLSPDSRRKIVNKILDVLKKHLPSPASEELEELENIADRFEKKIFTSSVAQDDYLKKISVKLMTMESKTQNTTPCFFPSNSSESEDMQPQGQALSMPMSTNQPEGGQQMIFQNIPNNAGVESCANLTSALPSVSGLSPASIPSVVGQQNVSGVSKNAAGNSSGPGLLSNKLADSQRQMPGRPQQQQQPQIPQQYPYQQQLLKPTFVHSHMQQSGMQMPSGLQSAQSIQHPQAILRQQQQAARIYQQRAAMMQQQQQHPIAQQPNAANMQRSQLIGKLNSVGEIRLRAQQNLQQQPQHLMAQHLLGSLRTQSGSSTMQSNLQSLQHHQHHLISQMQSTQPLGSLPQQKKELYQSQRPFLQASSSSPQTGQSNVGDWREEAHQRIKAMKEKYFPDLNEIYLKVASKLQLQESLPQAAKSEQRDKIKMIVSSLERVIAVLHISKDDITPSLKEKLDPYEDQIIDFINSNKVRKPQSQVRENQFNSQVQQNQLPSSPPKTRTNLLQSANSSGNIAITQPSLAIATPIERLLRAVKSTTSQAAVSDIASVVTTIDRIPGSGPGNGSRAAVGEDLAAMASCWLQARSFIAPDGITMKRKPLNIVDTVKFTGLDTPDLESTASQRFKRPRTQPNHALLKEIDEINLRLIDTVVDVCEQDVDDPTAMAERREGTIIKCFYIAVALCPTLKSLYASGQMQQIQPVRLLVPPNYPNCSPVLLDKLPAETSEENEDLSVKAKSRFERSLRSFSQPMSIREIAKAWDVCARGVMSEYAQQRGGGIYSSMFGTWEDC